jgi:hypothetical protein
MAKTLNTPKNALHKRQGKGKKDLNQLQTIFQYLFEHIATASMVSDATGIYQKNICRYKRDLEKVGRLWEIEKTYCKHTGFKAWYLTTNPSKAPKNSINQLNLF